MNKGTRRRLFAMIFATVAFSVTGLALALALKMPLDLALIGVPALGLFISGFEIFYFQSRRGRWLREMHPLKSLLIYDLILVAFGLVLQHLNYLLHGRLTELPSLYARYPVIIPTFLLAALLVILLIRIIGFVGGRNMFYLFIGKYHRPVWEHKVFMFLDIKGSTDLVDSLGPEQSKLLFGKFMFDASEPVTSNGGEIYRYQGDGFVAIWDWGEGSDTEVILQAVEELYAMLEQQQSIYMERFGVCPDFRIGIHGGGIITSEEGDIRRNIGFYGDTINIAARMEAKAKETGFDCVVTSDIAKACGAFGERLTPLGNEHVKGIERPLSVYGFNRRAARLLST